MNVSKLIEWWKFNTCADLGDISVPTGEISGSAIDFGGGLYYNTQDVYLGLSTLHITDFFHWKG